MTYPNVRDEWATIRAVLEGFSIARLGDGEFKLADGQGYAREPGSTFIAGELRELLESSDPNCLVGIPTLNPDGPKFENWNRHRERYARLLRPDRVSYCSAFITRPDSAPWINSVEYAGLVEAIWKCKRVTVVCEPKNKILALVQASAKTVKHIRCPSHQAYAQIDALELAVCDSRSDVVLLSAGPTATCLANRLAGRDRQAVDIGSAGGFLTKLLVP